MPELIRLGVSGMKKVRVDTFDFDVSLHPAYIGDIREIKNIVTDKYDCVICCQVLEHLEWRYFENIIRQLRHICKKELILSLPVHKVSFTIQIDFPKFKRCLQIIIQRLWIKKLPWKGEY